MNWSINNQNTEIIYIWNIWIREYVKLVDLIYLILLSKKKKNLK